METGYGQNRKCFHNVRFSTEEEKIIRERMGKYNYTRELDFIRDAVLEKRLIQPQVIKIEQLIWFVEQKSPDVMGEYCVDVIDRDTM